MALIDPAVFHDDAIAEETRAVNADILAKAALLPDPWAFPASVVREARRQGRGLMPLAPLSPRAETLEIPGPRGPIPLRILRPRERARGVYLHLHFGGWMLGSADMHDWLFERIADEAGLAVVSVEYRLAPEYPYPAGPDDCEAAALWLVREVEARFGTSHLTIGGESAGAHLSIVVLTRLRDRHGLKPFRAALLTAGCYDLSGTPSARQWGPEKLVINTRDVMNFARAFVPLGLPLDAPDISPIHARLAGLPPALVSVGTRDPLLDDSLFLAARWNAAGSQAELAVYPGGCHVFQMFPMALTEACLARQMAFLRASTE